MKRSRLFTKLLLLHYNLTYLVEQGVSLLAAVLLTHWLYIWCAYSKSCSSSPAFCPDPILPSISCIGIP